MDVAVSQAVSSLLQNTYSISGTAFWKIYLVKIGRFMTGLK
jgi:hypothetical protein